jgi:hypothetical protein
VKPDPHLRGPARISYSRLQGNKRSFPFAFAA